MKNEFSQFSQQIFSNIQILNFMKVRPMVTELLPSFGGEVKPSVPCCGFAACKRSLNVTCKSTFRQILAHAFPPFAARGLSGYMDEEDGLVTKVGTSKNT